MDDNNNQVNYGPDPINNGGVNYGPNPNQQPPVYNTAAGAAAQKNGMCTGAMVVGIIGLVLSCCGCGYLLPIVAIILGAIGKGKATTEDDRKHAQIGLICGIVGVVLSVISTIAIIIYNISAANVSSTYYYGY